MCARTATTRRAAMARRSRSALLPALALCATLFCYCIVSVAAQAAPPPPAGTCPPKPPPFDVQETSSQLFLDIAGALLRVAVVRRCAVARAARAMLPFLPFHADAVARALARTRAVIMLVCRFVGLIFKALGQPTVVGEIIAGAPAAPLCQRSLFARKTLSPTSCLTHMHTAQASCLARAPWG
jgi:hypothetical protein